MVATKQAIEQTLNQLGQVLEKSNMEIKELTNLERRKLFISKSNDLKKEGLSFSQLSEIIGMKYKRMKNIRSEKPPHVFPSAIELDLLLKLHEKRFPKVDESPVKGDELQGIKDKIQDLETRLKAQEAFNEAKRQGLIERLIQLGEKNIISSDEVKELRKLLGN